MNITNLARQWLLDNGYEEYNASFSKQLSSLCGLIEKVAYHQGTIGYQPDYDSNYGDDKTCLCGHSYYRHFDTYARMDPVGCKYCFKGYGEEKHIYEEVCPGFKAQNDSLT